MKTKRESRHIVLQGLVCDGAAQERNNTLEYRRMQENKLGCVPIYYEKENP